MEALDHPDEDRKLFPYYDPQVRSDLIQKPSSQIVMLIQGSVLGQLLSVAYGAEYEHSRNVRLVFFQ